MSRLRGMAAGVGRFIRDGWLIAGIVLAVFLAVEGVYRLQAWARRAARSPGAAPAALAAFPWGEEYARELAASSRMRWMPYVYFRRQPFDGRHITVDSLGLRRTVQPDGAASPNQRTVFLFGGSALWGSFQDDAGTIPSVVARELATRGIGDLRVVNFGESGWVNTQGVLELLLLLRAGERPAAVVFYDGLNDVASAAQSGVPGLPQNEFNRQREFDLGRRLFASDDSPGAEARAAAGLLQGAMARARVIQRLVQALPGTHREAGRDSLALAGGVASVYAGNASIVEALSRYYGFAALYVWQPSLHATRKPLAPAERELRDQIETSDFEGLLATLHRLAPPRIDSLMAALAPARFVNLSSAFDADTGIVFLDVVGHTTPLGAARVGSLISARLAPLLATPAAGRPARSDRGR